MTPAGVTCTICGQDMHLLGTGLVLGRVQASYLECNACGLVVLPNPSWLRDAYSEAITSLDIGLLGRGFALSRFTSRVIRAQGLSDGSFLDWAGGYGTLTRLMRDLGFDFHHHDPLCENMFAKGHEAGEQAPYDLVTAYEVLEHLPDPVESLRRLCTSTDLLLFTTYVLPSPAPQPEDWWYYTPETGQHVTFYSVRALELLAEHQGYRLLTDGVSRHLFYRGALTPATRFLFSGLALRLQRAQIRSRRLLKRSLGWPQPLTELDSAATRASLGAEQRRGDT